MNYPLLTYSFLVFVLFLFSCKSKNSSGGSRVEIAQSEYENALRKLLGKKSIDYEQCEIYLRAFKFEEILEVWAKNSSDATFKLIKSYDFCTNSGELGPKRREGDLQIPEGIYHINRFNPQSSFYLSLGLNYPNKSDLYFADKTQPGSDIFIHGACVSVGCIAIKNEGIKELYTLANQAKFSGQTVIRTDIFPIQFDNEISVTHLDELVDYQSNKTFWQNLEEVFWGFESIKQLHKIQVNEAGKYIVYESSIREILDKEGIDYEQCEIYLRAFKLEEELEVWAKNTADTHFTFIKSYMFCDNSGTLGPKRRQGDNQIPEGVYHIDRFNPWSRYNFSLGLNYPNESDKYFADKARPGGNIFIHGGCFSIGCIAITDEKIGELYDFASQTESNEQNNIRVDIFPIKFNREISKNYLPELPAYQINKTFWKNLETIFSDFENTKKLRKISVNEKGKYELVN